jgi:hypothetical protein
VLVSGRAGHLFGCCEKLKNVTPQQREQVDVLFSDLLEAPASDRAKVLAEVADAEVRAEVESLLEHAVDPAVLDATNAGSAPFGQAVGNLMRAATDAGAFDPQGIGAGAKLFAMTTSTNGSRSNWSAMASTPSTRTSVSNRSGRSWRASNIPTLPAFWMVVRNAAYLTWFWNTSKVTPSIVTVMAHRGPTFSRSS